MVSDRLKSLYDLSPRVLQNLAISAKGWQLKRRRRGGEFDALLSEALNRMELSPRELQTYREQRLQRFLEIASESSFWCERFDQYGVNVTSEEPFNELSKLPVLTKQDVKQADRSLKPRSVSSDNLLDCHTSGTTGGGLQFVQTKRALQEQWAIWWRYRRRHGIDRDTWHGYFGGIPIVPLTTNSPPLWRVNYPDRQVMFSTYHLKPEHVESYVAEINDRNLAWLHGYPSALALLANMMLDADIPAPSSAQTVTIGAETLFDHQCEAIQEAFEVSVRQHYGLEEAVVNISECSEGTLHVDEDFAHVEFIPRNSGEGYRIIGTNWTNPAFPLLRYDTGDIATLAESNCPCGCHGRVVDSLLGRQDDYVVLPDGARVGRLDHIFKDLESVREAQIYQPDREQVVFRVVPGDGYDDNTESAILKNARTRLGGDLDVSVTPVEEIERTNSGKMKFVVSDIKEMQIGQAAH